jgi:hypothetical protein
MNERDEFDTLLDRLLANYGEPAPGMEKRVLAEVQAAGRSRALWWTAAGVAAALLTAALLFFPAGRPSGSDARRDRAGMPAPVHVVPVPVPSTDRPSPDAMRPRVAADVRRARDSSGRHQHTRRPAAQAEADPGNRVPLPLIVPPDAQERALLIALGRPGFVEVLDAAQAPHKWDDPKPNDSPAPSTR